MTRNAALSQPFPVPPPRARVRMYRHGLGDCIYLEFPRSSGAPYRMMIDCGLVLGAKDATARITEVMDHVVAAAGPEGLDMLVVTHPHWDHVSGFVQARDSFAALKTREVWMAWTENPHDELAIKLKSTFALAERSLRAGLKATAELGMDQARNEAMSLLEFIGEEGAFSAAKGRGTTADAVASAAAKASEAGRAPHFCLPGEEPFTIPGTDARIFVLGPPRNESELRQMDPTTREPETYGLTGLGSFLHLGGAFGARLPATDTDFAEDEGQPFAERFAIPLDVAEQHPFFADHYFSEGADWQRIDSDWADEITPLALLLDRAVNNSSLALAIELERGGDVILLAADAQVGNWLSWLKLEWTVDGTTITGPDLIARTVAYKVGHHASLNATLRQEGVEKMARLRYSLIPVDAEQARVKGWGNNIPFGDLLDALARSGQAVVLRSDQDWNGRDPAVTSDELFFELSL